MLFVLIFQTEMAGIKGEEAREHYSKAVEQTQKELLDDLYKENSKESIK